MSTVFPQYRDIFLHHGKACFKVDSKRMANSTTDRDAVSFSFSRPDNKHQRRGIPANAHVWCRVREARGRPVRQTLFLYKMRVF